MGYYYAQLDEDDICVGLSSLSDVLDAPHMIRLTDAQYLSDLIGKKYNRKNGAFRDAPVVKRTILNGGESAQ